MVGKLVGVILTLLLVVSEVQCESPPGMKDSFIAWGEIVEAFPGTADSITLQMAFEETYDASTQNAAFLLYLWGKNITFIKDYEANQTFLYLETDEHKMRCTETSEKEWIGSEIMPGLQSYKDDNGTVKFSLAQLLNIPDNYLMDKKDGVAMAYRGIPAKSWAYEIKQPNEDGAFVDLNIIAFWSEDKWNTSAGQKVMTPLGFNISKITWSPYHVANYVINVFGFVPNTYDRKYFEPLQGIFCLTRNSTKKFPDVKNIKAISLHSEMALPQYQELRYIDTWFDPTNQLVRIDVERFKGENPMERKQKPYQSEIAIGKMGVVFRWGYFKGEAECEVKSFNEYENDLQNLFDIKQNLAKWHMGKIFGLNDTLYVYMGKTTMNDVPCHLYQGLRTDWPDESFKIESMWEWCFNINMTSGNDVVMFQGGEFGLVSANIIILSDPNTNFNNCRMNHHFYEVKEQDPKILDSTSFDIGRCFKDTEKTALQFYLDVVLDKDNIHLAENATSDVSFLQKWKAAIYQHSGLPAYSLRLSEVRATIDDSRLYIKFFILGVHSKLPEANQKQPSASDAEKTLRDNINDGKVSIKHPWSQKEPLTLTAEKNSLSLQIDATFEPQTLPSLPPTTPTSPTKFPFSLQPDETTLSPFVRRTRFTGYGSGTVAGVSIAMLLVGLSVGSAGTFYKFNGFPACMKR